MSKKKNLNQKLKNSETKSNIRTKWTINLLNTSDVGYPDEESRYVDGENES